MRSNRTLLTTSLGLSGAAIAFLSVTTLFAITVTQMDVEITSFDDVIYYAAGESTVSRLTVAGTIVFSTISGLIFGFYLANRMYRRTDHQCDIPHPLD